jgi:EXLDI family protein
MPVKSLHLTEADAETFERAERLAGSSLPTIIMSAVTEFLGAAGGPESGERPITMRIGPAGSHRLVRFTGRELARWRDRPGDDRQIAAHWLYQSARGRFVLYTWKTPDWAAQDWYDWRSYSWPEDFSASGEYEAFDSLDDVRTRLPDHVRAAAERAMTGVRVEDADL